MTKKIIVLGSNSFSGSHFVDIALEQGYQICGISRSPEYPRVFLPYKWSKDKKKLSLFKFKQYDLNHNLDNIMEIVTDFQPDYVVNFSSQSMVAQSWENPEHWFQTNTLSTVLLHNRLRHCKFLKKYVHVSTPEVYGSCDGVVIENTNYQPSTPYAVSRAAADMSLMTFFTTHGFPVVFTRAANVYGPGQQLYRIIPRTILFFLTGKTLELHGGGSSIRSFIDIRDVMDGTLKTMEHGEPGHIFHFSTPKNISIRTLVEKIADLMGVSFDNHVKVVDDRPGKDAAYLLDSKKARNNLGWQDTIDLDQGIKDTMAWVKQHLNEILKHPIDYIHKP